ncbi:GRP family sugar transporter [Bowdeniella massiliensis]|uniref:GRP family sugar transporter n=1 Tax=Bowdeniella massiliensis TaxID=2932264 RepID=UPI00202833E6
MTFVLALLPSLIWGITNLLTPWVGGNLRQQLMGMSTGALALSAVVFAVLRPEISLPDAALAYASGLLISAGLYYILWAFKAIGVSRALPLTTGIQLVGLALFGVIGYGEWATTLAKVFGGLALIVITAGTAAISWEDRRSERVGDAADYPVIPLRYGLPAVLLASACFITYPAMLRVGEVSGFGTIAPQALGMFTGCALFTAARVGDAPVRLLLPGSRFAHAVALGGDHLYPLGARPRPWRTDLASRKFAAFVGLGALWLSAVAQLVWNNENIGVATAFPLSQLGVVISTLGALYWLKEPKTGRERRAIFAGAIALGIGAVLIGVAKGFDL